MPTIILRFKRQNPPVSYMPIACPKCGSGLLQRWGRSAKVIAGHDRKVIQIERWRCKQCLHVSRHYPSGSNASVYPQPLRCPVMLCRELGHSTRSIDGILDIMGVKMSRMSIWRSGHQHHGKDDSHLPIHDVWDTMVIGPGRMQRLPEEGILIAFHESNEIIPLALVHDCGVSDLKDRFERYAQYVEIESPLR